MPAVFGRAGLPVAALVLLAIGAAAIGQGGAPATLREGFEGPKTAWQQEATDVSVRLLAHDRSDRAAHEGRQSEHFRFNSQAGSAFYYSYRLPKIPVTDDLAIVLFVRSNPAGVKLMARVVLPEDIDPDTGRPAFITVEGPFSEVADRWERLELKDVAKALGEQARVLRAAGEGRKVSLAGAYLDRLVVNLYGAPGDAEVFLDDLAISPVPASAVAEAANLPIARAPEGGPATPGEARPGAGIKMNNNRLSRDGYDWVPTIIRAPGADLSVLRKMGPDVLALDLNDDPEMAREAVRLGFRLMPMIDGRSGDGLREVPSILADVAAYPARDAVAFWNLGEDLGAPPDLEARRAQLERARALLKGLRNLPAGEPKLATGTVVGHFRQYAQSGRSLDLIGVNPAAWGTVQDPIDTISYLDQRRKLTALDNLQGSFWAWVPASAPVAFREAVWGRDTPPSWGDPQVLPEQIRMYAFAALAAGYRGLGFLGDDTLTSPAGRARRYEIALVKAELDLIESIIARGTDPIQLLPVFPPDRKVQIQYSAFNTMGMMSRQQKDQKVEETLAHPSMRAASIVTRDGRSRLLLVADYPYAGQWQPTQMAINDLKVRAQVLESAQGWEISLGGVRNLETSRVPGGRDFIVPEFFGTAIVLATPDRDLVQRLESEVARLRPWAIPLAIRQAEDQLERVIQVHTQLVRLGVDLHDRRDEKKNVGDAADLLNEAREALANSKAALAREDYPVAWSEARRTGRPLRLLMRDHWDQARVALAKATKEALNNPDPEPSPTASVASRRSKERPELLETAIASPPLLSFYTLPQHYIWLGWLRDYEFGPNLLSSGSFEDPEALKEEGWDLDAGYAIDGVVASIRHDKKKGWKKGHALTLKVAAARPKEIDRLPPYLDHPVAAIRTPPIPVGAGHLMRIKVMVKMPTTVPQGAGGLVVRDSLGGEPLQFRFTAALPQWREVVLYRRAPASGTMTVLIGLAGFGELSIDNLEIDRLTDPAEPIARRPQMPRPRTATRAPEPGRTAR
jgi:hypothetical protein